MFQVFCPLVSLSRSTNGAPKLPVMNFRNFEYSYFKLFKVLYNRKDSIHIQSDRERERESEEHTFLNTTNFDNSFVHSANVKLEKLWKRFK